jgi:hypothetical protein
VRLEEIIVLRLGVNGGCRDGTAHFSVLGQEGVPEGDVRTMRWYWKVLELT